MLEILREISLEGAEMSDAVKEISGYYKERVRTYDGELQFFT